jgi:ABC-type glycerol-3-phosphate transport system substrate-binding protein
LGDVKKDYYLPKIPEEKKVYKEYLSYGVAEHPTSNEDTYYQYPLDHSYWRLFFDIIKGRKATSREDQENAESSEKNDAEEKEIIQVIG